MDVAARSAAAASITTEPALGVPAGVPIAREEATSSCGSTPFEVQPPALERADVAPPADDGARSGGDASITGRLTGETPVDAPFTTRLTGEMPVDAPFTTRLTGEAPVDAPFATRLSGEVPGDVSIAAHFAGEIAVGAPFTPRMIAHDPWSSPARGRAAGFGPAAARCRPG